MTASASASAAPRVSVRLRFVQEVSFARSEATNYASLPAKLRQSLRPGIDCVCFYSKTGNQVVFVRAPHFREHDVIESVRIRLPGRRRWNPLLLADYAASEGWELVGLRRFAEYYKALTEA